MLYGRRAAARGDGAGAAAVLAVVLAAGAMIVVGACEAPRQVKTAPPTPLRDVPSVLRGTIGAEAEVHGVDPVLVSGLGIVVGLSGTGGGELPVQVQATMERELARGGIGKGGAATDTDIGAVSPQAFLRRSDVAVVIVQAAIAPGSPKGSGFDVFVRTLPGSSVTSLEGGRLWTTELRIGPAAVFGAVKTRKIAEARGSVFINPFSAPSVGPSGEVQLTRTVGRVLGGGKVTDPLKLELALDSDSHARARSIVAAINSRFPPGPGDEGPIARGRGQSTFGMVSPDKPSANPGGYQSIAVSVPTAYQDQPGEFLQLLRHLRIDQSFAQESARQYVEELKSQTALADNISWILQAVGKPAIPFLVKMYDYPEFAPRMAALRAGARLGDQRAAGPLMELAKTGPASLRSQAIRLLGDMPPNPAVNLTLRELLSAKDLDVRVAAYEGLRKRGDGVVRSVVVGSDPRQARFALDIIPDGEPLVYVTQQKEARIVLFGVGSRPEGARRSALQAGGLWLNRPMLVSAFEDRLMLTSDASDQPVRLMYRDPRTGQTVQDKAPDDIVDLVIYLARRGSADDPTPGLGMSYSDIVGVLYELTRQDGLAAAFATEEDRLRGEVYEASRSTAMADRPEAESPKGDEVMVFKELPAAGPPLPDDKGGNGKITRVVPLSAPKKKAE